MDLQSPGGSSASTAVAACAFVFLSALALHNASAAEPNPRAPKGSVGVSAQIDWQTSPLDLDLRGMNGERYAFRCPPGKPMRSRVAGSGPYTDDSSICTAAVHAGVIHAKDGGEVIIEIRPGQARYAGSDHNYIKSGDYDGTWDGSFVVVREDAPVDHH
ncbi:MAG TPA: LCCL domain-containing protein [Rhodanobacteraceae bacterium]|nr:LCCL domain-containing protein [Rhodanobacteraceae bacterium]